MFCVTFLIPLSTFQLLKKKIYIHLQLVNSWNGGNFCPIPRYQEWFERKITVLQARLDWWLHRRIQVLTWHSAFCCLLFVLIFWIEEDTKHLECLNCNMWFFCWHFMLEKLFYWNWKLEVKIYLDGCFGLPRKLFEPYKLTATWV